MGDAMKDTVASSDLVAKLESLKEEHRDLDSAIAMLGEQPQFDQVQVQRLKKRKLKLKDLIDQLESGDTPDMIA
jgi:hypothetical protein